MFCDREEKRRGEERRGEERKRRKFLSSSLVCLVFSCVPITVPVFM